MMGKTAAVTKTKTARREKDKSLKFTFSLQWEVSPLKANKTPSLWPEGQSISRLLHAPKCCFYNWSFQTPWKSHRMLIIWEWGGSTALWLLTADFWNWTPSHQERLLATRVTISQMTVCFLSGSWTGSCFHSQPAVTRFVVLLDSSESVTEKKKIFHPPWPGLHAASMFSSYLE